MECLARSHRVVQVVGEGGVGYLYFDRGRIVHATTAQRTGEAAALEILDWTNGSFQSCERGWPAQATIRTSHEASSCRPPSCATRGALRTWWRFRLAAPRVTTLIDTRSSS